MTYGIDVDPGAQEQILALPAHALPPLAAAMAMQLTSWNGASINKSNPDGNVRTLPFGAAGLITYLILILDDQQRVDVLDVLWAAD